MKTKKGMASLYLVAFTTLLLGIVTMSFARVMISESREATNSDLSQSAFDSALAGIEDAKTAIIMYEACQNGATEVGSDKISCDDIVDWMTTGFKTGDCDVIKRILSNNKAQPGEVEVSANLNQYYTCVPIANDAPTYRSILNEDSRSRVIPARLEGNHHTDVVGIELEWYTPSSSNSAEELVYMGDIPGYENKYVPLGTKDNSLSSLPILTFELFQTDPGFTMAQLDVNNPENTGTDHAMIMLYPDSSRASDAISIPTKDSSGNDITVTPGTFVSARNLLDASNKSNLPALNTDKDANVVPKLVTCDYDDGGARCRATIEFPATYGGKSDNASGSYATGGAQRAKQTFAFRVSLPYGSPQTDFSIKPCTTIQDNHCKDYVNFSGAQYIVDSTGRASTLYRRIIARIETSPKFIFPEYAVQVSGNNSTIEKDFWVAENCWFTDGKGNSGTCANNGDVKN